ncbi:MAG: hypothetical protein ABI363_06240 [Nitrosospira sp.]
MKTFYHSGTTAIVQYEGKMREMTVTISERRMLRWWWTGVVDQEDGTRLGRHAPPSQE